MKKLLLLACLLSSTAFAKNVKLQVGVGYEKRESGSVTVAIPQFQTLDFDCGIPYGFSKDIKESIAETEIVANVFAIETKKNCLVTISYKLANGEGIMFGQIRIPSSGSVNETVFHGVPAVLDETEVQYTPTFWLAP